MARLRPWREIVLVALQGHQGQAVTNESVYKAVAKAIGAKTLTTNQKAKVRQQLQLVGKKPAKGKKKGEWTYVPKLPPNSILDRIVEMGPDLNGIFFEKTSPLTFYPSHRTFVFQYEVHGTVVNWLDWLMPIAEELEKAYGNVDTSIEFLTTVERGKDDFIEQWWNLAYGGSPTIAAGQAPAEVQNYQSKTERIYQGSIDRILAFSFTLYVKI